MGFLLWYTLQIKFRKQVYDMAQSVHTISFLHTWIRNKVSQGDFCIDATAGKGKDTALLAELVGPTGKVVAMDIQQDAINATASLLDKKGLSEQVTLVLDSHANLTQYAEPDSVACIVFNLGYLPGGDHTIATHAESTIQALEQSLTCLKPLGIIAMAIYHGGDSGFVERDAVLDWLKTVDHKQYTVMVTDFYNRPNHPPLAVLIIREQN